MKKSAIVWICVAVAVGLLAMFLIGGYNSLISTRELVDTKLSDIDTQLQRRLDLIPNLVNTVKGYTNHESEVLGAVSDARARLAGAQSTAEKAEANTALSGALSRLLLVVENYPNLKADTQFTALTDELAGTENRIAVARRDYNEAAKSYNTSIKTFPRNLYAGLFGFAPVEYFTAAEGATQVPQVNF